MLDWFGVHVCWVKFSSSQLKKNILTFAVSWFPHCKESWRCQWDLGAKVTLWNLTASLICILTSENVTKSSKNHCTLCLQQTSIFCSITHTKSLFWLFTDELLRSPGCSVTMSVYFFYKLHTSLSSQYVNAANVKLCWTFYYQGWELA